MAVVGPRPLLKEYLPLYNAHQARRHEVRPVRLYCQWGIRYMGFEGWKRKIFKYLEK